MAVALCAGVGVVIYALRWQTAYSEAETRFSAAQEFGRSLAQRLAQGGRREAELADIKALLREERFSRLRDSAFVPPLSTDALVTLRINDHYDFPVQLDGSVGWRKRK